ncbi:serine/threonine-protein kinase tousled-like 2 isoform X2 [Amphiura filiformis]|uniref:serine/threonine-protein kinase tousled-like 2 isoform X2 n=1 Tax=Amphiura filiformis TaxID=82378 RepID=UPI003B20BDDA
MQDFKNFDPQRLELLEARIMGNRHTPIVISDDEHDKKSNDSAGSASRNSHAEEQPEIKVTPQRKERRRKRKNDKSENSNDGSGEGVPGVKKISDFFRGTSGLSGSPGRGHTPSKSPSSSSHSMFPPSPSGNNLEYSSLHHSQQQQQQTQQPLAISTHSLPPTGRRELRSTETQTMMTAADIVRLYKVENELKAKSETMEQLARANKEMQRQLELIKKEGQKQIDLFTKSTSVIKELLIKESTIEKKEARTKSMENRLRLGQFTTQRQGASFVEQWVDGYAFTNLTKKQEKLGKEREELEQQRKLLLKRKPPNQTVTAKGNKPKGNGLDDGFAKPANFCHTPQEYFVRDEVIKLRLAALKKEEADLQSTLNDLERERNVHIREMKRIHNEDQSRFKDHTVLNERYLLLNLLGKGGFSEVHKGFDLKELRYVACKVHQLNKDWQENKKASYIKHAVREYEIHKSLDNHRIVKLYDVFEIDQHSFCTVLEYCSGSDLDIYLKMHKTISEREARSIILQMVSALKYLSEIKPPVIHYDLKPGNILLGQGSTIGDIKITDFGLSKRCEDEFYDSQEGMDLTSQGAGTYWYLPPETFRVGEGTVKINRNVDIWSMGVIFYQCLYGKKPFGHNLSQATILEQSVILKATDPNFPAKPAVSPEAKDFIRSCLIYDAQKRPDVEQISKHAYLTPPGKRSNAANSGSNAAALAMSTASNSSMSLFNKGPGQGQGQNQGQSGGSGESSSQ